MLKTTYQNILGANAYLALSLALPVMVGAWVQPASALVISFEQSEGFPAPVLIPDPAPGGTVDPRYNFTGFAGGPNTGYPGHPDGPVPDKPNFSTNGGAVTNWGLESPARTHGTWFIDDGPGGLDIKSGGVSTCVGPDVNNCAPAPVSGAAMAGFGVGTLGGVGLIYEGVMDLDNSQNIQLQSFWYANRGNGPPRLQVEYYANDVNETFLGVNSYALGTDPGSNTVGNGDRWVGVGPNFEPKFQLITPTAPFQGVALGKVVFRSFADGTPAQNSGQNPSGVHNDEANGDFPSPTGHGTFFLDDITIQGNGGAFNPNNYTRISFEASEGFPDHDGAVIRDDVTNTGVLNVVTGFEINDSVIAALQIDHGPGGKGFPRPESEPNPIHGSQLALSRPGTSGIHEVTIDLHNPGNFGLAGFWYANRGNFPPKLTVEYYDINENLIGENVYMRGDGGVGVGLDAQFNPKFQFIEPSEPFQNVALSKIKLISSPPNPATGGGAFSMDDVLLKPNSGSFNPNNKVRVSFEVSEGFSGTDGAVIAEVDDPSITALPAGVVDDWILSGPGAAYFQIDKGPGGQGFGDEDDPVSGSQFALSTNQGNGDHVLTMDLNNSANLALESFYFANRGNFPPQLTVEYFGLDEQSLGADVYTAGVDGGVAVGLGPGFEPKFQLIEPSAQFLGVALSKLVFTSEGGVQLNLGAAFAIDDILFQVVTPGLDGDYNFDGTVDAADYVVWRKTDGTQPGYNLWRANFGNTNTGSGAGSDAGSSGVPEPACWTLAILAAACVTARRPGASFRRS